MDKYGKRERYDAAQRQIEKGLWKVTDGGEIFSVFMQAVIGSERDGYMRVAVPCSDNNYRYVSTHRVVWEFYNGPSDLNLTINHKNGDGLDNNLENLEITTNADNCDHAHKELGRGNGSRNKGSVNPRARLNEGQVVVIKQRLRNGDNYRTIAKEYNVSPLTIHSIKRGANWKHVN